MKDKEKKSEAEHEESAASQDATETNGSETEATDNEAKLKEASDKYTRLYAEYDNFRKRTAREKIDWIKSAGEEVILKVLPVLDDIERAISHNKSVSDPEVLKQGLEIIHQKFKNILTNKGIEPMVAKGQPFDPELHDAITSIAAATEDLKGKVIEEVEKGYMMNGKVIRHAKVVVGN
jgi:molecular chaperone GrpE